MVSAQAHDEDSSLLVWEIAPGSEPISLPDPQWVTEVLDTARRAATERQERRARLAAATQKLLDTMTEEG